MRLNLYQDVHRCQEKFAHLQPISAGMVRNRT